MSRHSAPTSCHWDQKCVMRSSHHQSNDTPSQLLRSAMVATAFSGWTAICFGSDPVGSRDVLRPDTGVNVSALTSY